MVWLTLVMDSRPARRLLVPAVVSMIAVAVVVFSTLEPPQGEAPSFGKPATPTPPASESAAPLVLAGVWNPIALAPIDGRTGHSSVWTGREMVIWGGEPGPESDGAPILSDGADGARFAPDEARWRPIASAPLGARAGHLAAWSGTEMLVWGGKDGDGRPLFDGAGYDPVGDRWRLLAASPINGPGESVGAWIGQAWLVIHGFGDATRDSVQTAWYEPQLDQWRELDGLEVPLGSSVSMAGIGFEALLIIKPDSGRSVGMRLTPRNVAFESAQPPFGGLNAGSSMAWTGEVALVATSGETVPGTDSVWDQVVLYDPVADSWRIAALPPDALHSLEPVWSGRYAFFFGGELVTRAYDPTGDRWFEIVPPADDGFREAASEIWAGDQLIVWGGSGAGTGTRRRDGVAFVPTPGP